MVVAYAYRVWRGAKKTMASRLAFGLSCIWAAFMTLGFIGGGIGVMMTYVF